MLIVLVVYSAPRPRPGPGAGLDADDSSVVMDDMSEAEDVVSRAAWVTGTASGGVCHTPGQVLSHPGTGCQRGARSVSPQIA